MKPAVEVWQGVFTARSSSFSSLLIERDRHFVLADHFGCVFFNFAVAVRWFDFALAPFLMLGRE
jgi:hypothetical protein